MGLEIGQQQLEIGHPLDSAVIEKGLRELNPDVSFDLANRRPSDYHYALKAAGRFKDLQKQGSGVYYSGEYVCAMDRGTVPEYKVFAVDEGMQSIPMADAEKYDESRICYIEILPRDPFYHHALLKAQRKDDNYLLENGRVFRYEAFIIGKVRGPVLKVGWRHTFEHLLSKKIPGITRRSLAEKFSVNMNVIPVGSRDVVTQELMEE